MGQLLLREGQSERALPHFQKAMLRRPESDRPFRLRSVFHIGKCLLEMNQASEAKMQFEQYLEEHNRLGNIREQAQALYWLALSHSKQMQFVECEALLRQAQEKAKISLDRFTEMQASLELSQVLWRKGDEHGATVMHEAAVRLANLDIPNIRVLDESLLIQGPDPSQSTHHRVSEVTL